MYYELIDNDNEICGHVEINVDPVPDIIIVDGAYYVRAHTCWATYVLSEPPFVVSKKVN